MFSIGFTFGMAFIVTLLKLSWKWKLRVLSYPLTVDILVFLFLTIIHWGSFTGVGSATIGAMVVSLILSAGRWLVGYFEKGEYIPGRINVIDKI